MTAAQAVCHELEEHGIRCWMAPRDIPVGGEICLGHYPCHPGMQGGGTGLFRIFGSFAVG